MKEKNFKPFNMRTHESLREETCGDTTGLVARWQTRLEARPGYGVYKLVCSSHLRSHKQLLT